MMIELPDLPYPQDALEPHMSAKTLDVHHGKHHRKYVDTLNDLIAGTSMQHEPLDAIVRATATRDDAKQINIFNNAAQTWNHDFFWRCMRPKGGGEPAGDLARGIAKNFAGLAGFKRTFKEAAIGQFGSGWVWLVSDGGALRVVGMPNAANPLVTGQTALLCCDVWEHAYYLDYQDRRAEFVDAFLGKLVNWEFVAEQMERAG